MNNGNDRFVRVLAQRDVIALAFGAMIGFSWIVLAGDWVRNAGALGSVVAVLIGGVMVAFVLSGLPTGRILPTSVGGNSG